MCNKTQTWWGDESSFMFFTPSNRMNMWASCLTPGGVGEKMGLTMQSFRHPIMLRKDIQKIFNKFQITYDTFNSHLNCKHNFKIWTHLQKTCCHLNKHKVLFTISLEDRKIKSIKSVADLHWEAIMLEPKTWHIESLGRNVLAGYKNTDGALQCQDQNIKPKA